MSTSYKQSTVIGMALDPIHVGTGGARLGRVDLSIVRDPVTRIPKIPGSSLAGVCRSYAAMAQQEANPSRQINGKPKPYYPDCAGQGQPDQAGKGGHCGQPDCPICTVFGFARGVGGGFAGLAAFSDAHVLLFPVATREGPLWVTCPSALRFIGCEITEALDNALYREQQQGQPLNLGWLLLEVKKYDNGNNWENQIHKPLKDKRVPECITQRLGLISDKLFSHVVNSNLEVRTSVSINPETGAAEEGALFSYEALPRATVLVWDVTCKNPKHFQVGGKPIAAQVNSATIDQPDKVFDVVKTAHDYLEHLGIGSMGTRGMGRLRVVYPSRTEAAQPGAQQPGQTEVHSDAQSTSVANTAAQA
jgi:CRISPR-associated protein Cmr4